VHILVSIGKGQIRLNGLRENVIGHAIRMKGAIDNATKLSLDVCVKRLRVQLRLLKRERMAEACFGKMSSVEGLRDSLMVSPMLHDGCSVVLGSHFALLDEQSQQSRRLGTSPPTQSGEASRKMRSGI